MAVVAEVGEAGEEIADEEEVAVVEEGEAAEAGAEEEAEEADVAARRRRKPNLPHRRQRGERDKGYAPTIRLLFLWFLYALPLLVSAAFSLFIVRPRCMFREKTSRVTFKRYSRGFISELAQSARRYSGASSGRPSTMLRPLEFDTQQASSSRTPSFLILGEEKLRQTVSAGWHRSTSEGDGSQDYAGQL